jgi:hypothetical protein
MTTVSPQGAGTPHSEEWKREVQDLVNATAPRLFAVVQEWRDERGEPDAHVAAWGLAYEDGSARVAGAEGRMAMDLAAPEGALRVYGRRPESAASLVWVGPGAGLAS